MHFLSNIPSSSNMFPNYFVYFNRVIAKSKSVIVVYNDCFITNSGVPGSSFTYYMNSLWDKLGSCVLTNAEYETSKYKFHSIDKPLPVTWKSRERGYEGIADVLWSLEEIDPYFTRRGGSVHGLVRCVSVWFHTFLLWQTGAESHWYFFLLGLPRLQTQCLSTDGFWWWEWCCRSLGPSKNTQIQRTVRYDFRLNHFELVFQGVAMRFFLPLIWNLVFNYSFPYCNICNVITVQ